VSLNTKRGSQGDPQHAFRVLALAHVGLHDVAVVSLRPERLDGVFGGLLCAPARLEATGGRVGADAHGEREPIAQVVVGHALDARLGHVGVGRRRERR
jgi:hypothetical protein